MKVTTLVGQLLFAVDFLRMFILPCIVTPSRRDSGGNWGYSERLLTVGTPSPPPHTLLDLFFKLEFCKMFMKHIDLKL